MTSSQNSPEQEPNSPQPEQPEQGNNCPVIVGVGASAGGLEAFSQLLRHLPNDTGMAFVLIFHLAPDSESMLSEILTRETSMPVTQVQDGMAVEPNSIYVIPPNTKMFLNQERLRLAAREATYGQYMPVDAFFKSLAQERGNRAIGVVLSGSDADGSVGVETIHEVGGITFAQSLDTARFTGMPSTAIGTGQVDFTLPIPEIVEELVKISRHPYITEASPSAPTSTTAVPESNALTELFAILRQETGVNFSQYKRTTLMRRIQRRMALFKLETLGAYVHYLRQNREEVDALYHDILIIVTSFFRDGDTFSALKHQVLPEIVADKSSKEPLRVWVAGCATGEEAYSIAIAVLEFLRDRSLSHPIQIFATDLSEWALERARTGIYHENQMAALSQERRRRFFTPTERGFEVNKRMRELCVFARQNLISDPPFSRLDLVSCRNVLIYLSQELQQRVLPIFHYSLNPGGFLWLGRSENAGEASDLFVPFIQKHRIFRRRGVATRLNLEYIGRDGSINAEVSVRDGRVDAEFRPEGAGSELNREANRILMERYVPVGVLTDKQFNILQFRGEVDPYLRPPLGEATFNLLRMARPSILVELRAATQQAKREENAASRTASGVRVNGEEKMVEIEVVPLPEGRNYGSSYLVQFKPLAVVESPPTPTQSGSNADRAILEQEVARLEQELSTAKQELADAQEYLQASTEEKEATNQRLAAANEEILSSNEELQSTNEELQTAKEEKIQSANEELKTTNEELQNRNEEARSVNDDLNNLLNSVDIPILMIDRDMRIRRFTTAMQDVFNLIGSDTGREVGDIRHNLLIDDLDGEIARVIHTLEVLEREVQNREGHWYLLRVRPYKTSEEHINGAVVVLVDIEAIKHSAEELRISQEYATAIVEHVPQPLVVLDDQLRVHRANRSYYELFQAAPEHTRGRSFFELGNGAWNHTPLREGLELLLAGENSGLESVEVEQQFESIGDKVLSICAVPLMLPQLERIDGERMILLAIEDVTERRRLETNRTQLVQAEAARAQAEAANQGKDEFISILSHELRTPLNSILGWAQLLQRQSQNPAQHDEQLLAEAIDAIYRNAQSQARLIDDLLDISRIIRGQLRLDFRPVSLARIVRTAVTAIRPSAEGKTISLETNFDGNSGNIFADSERIQQAISNLLSNAVKFTPPGGRIEVRFSCSFSHAQIQIRDTGIGIERDRLQGIFEGFQRERRSSEGLGLGLTIVRRLVEMHGGEVMAESEGRGQGSTFTIRLPLTNVEWDTSPQAEPTEDIDLSGISILIVEDDRDALNFTRTVLEQQGARVIVATTGIEALAVLEQSVPDIFICDINLPDIEGYELLDRIRGRLLEEGEQEIPAIAMTAYAEREDIQRSLAAGFDYHISKPIEIPRLIEAIAELVNLEEG